MSSWYFNLNVLCTWWCALNLQWLNFLLVNEKALTAHFISSTAHNIESLAIKNCKTNTFCANVPGMFINFHHLFQNKVLVKRVYNHVCLIKRLTALKICMNCMKRNLNLFFFYRTLPSQIRRKIKTMHFTAMPFFR